MAGNIKNSQPKSEVVPISSLDPESRGVPSLDAARIASPSTLPIVSEASIESTRHNLPLDNDLASYQSLDSALLASSLSHNIREVVRKGERIYTEELDTEAVLEHFEEIVKLHTFCFGEAPQWQEKWVDYPRDLEKFIAENPDVAPEERPDVTSIYLLDKLEKGCKFFAAFDHSGELSGVKGKILGVGILKYFSSDDIEAYDIKEFGAQPGDAYMLVMFNDFTITKSGVFSRLVQARLEAALLESNSRMILIRTNVGNDLVSGYYKRHFGFKELGTRDVQEAGTTVERVWLGKDIMQERLPFNLCTDDLL